MSISENDPRLTAYALGEMTDAERHAFESELTESESAQREVSEIGATALLLSRELSDSAPATLTAEQRAAIAAAIARRGDAPGKEDPEGEADSETEQSAKVVPFTAKRSWRSRVWIPAAALAAAAACGLFLVNERSGSEEAPAYKAASATADPHIARQDALREAQEFGMIGLIDGKEGGTGTKAKSDLNSPALVYQGAAPSKAREDVPGLDADVARVPETPALVENPFVSTAQDTQSTFSIDVDTASYSMVRRAITEGQLPHPTFVRIEEMVNYFSYSYEKPDDEAFSVNVDASEAPWARSHRLVRVGLQGKTIKMEKRPASNLVFLIDVSGSMNGSDRLPLLKQAFRLLVDQLDERDSVAIAVYAGSSGLVLPPTPGNQKRTILDALENLHAGGSTNGGQGIQLAYETAAKAFVQGGTNRVLLATDGDFNVGTTSRDDLVSLVQQKAKGGVFLSVLGFGRGNFNDGTMEALADKGNGNYAYIDGMSEAKKVLVEQASGTLLTIAKDVKIQVTFDPKTVESFRLIGYENRVMSHRDFNDDTKDAGEIGAGHRVTALYEVVPKRGAPAGSRFGGIALRYKQPDGTTSRLVEGEMVDPGTPFEDATTDFRFAASVAGFGMLLRNSAHKGDLGYEDVLRFARDAVGDDADGRRKELVDLVERASKLASARP